MSAARETTRRHDGSVELANRLGPAPAEHQGPSPAPAISSNRAREALAARDRGAGGEVPETDFLRQFAGAGAPPLPPPPDVGDDPEDQPPVARSRDFDDEQGSPAPLAIARAGAATRRAPTLPAPPQPITPVERRPWAG